MLSLPENLTKDTVLKYVQEQTIFEYYLGHSFKIGDMYYSPFREEKTPSFNIYINKYNGRLWFKDFGKYSGDCFRLVQHLHQDCSFMEALEIVNRDLSLGIGKVLNIKSVKLPKRKLPQKEKYTIEVKIQSFNKLDLNYWNQYNITEAYLKAFKVFSTRKIWINGYPTLDWSYIKENPIYSYFFKPNFKLYRPKELDKTKKWKSNLEPEQWLGLKQLPKTADHLIITKAYKDVILLRTLGIYAIAVNGESHSFPSSLISNLKQRFKNIIILYDNDKVGIKFAKEKAELHDLDYVYIPEGEPKDITDFYKEYNKEDTLYLLDDLGIYQYARTK